jgi:homoserine dehydrogenase
MVRVGLLGLGTVGQAVLQLNQSFGPDRFDFARAAVRTPSKHVQAPIPVTVDPHEVLDDPSIDVVIEVAGGREPARGWILHALAQGKAVITANKELIAYHGPELLAQSRQSDAFLGFEAAVGGGIPVVDTLRWHLSTAPIERIYGVLNGTCNYLLNQMARGVSYQEALSQAQAAGFAEADPSDDVRGWDAARKLVILTYLGFGAWIEPDTLTVQGLEDWPGSLLARIARQGLALRLLAAVERGANGHLLAEVRPILVPSTSPLFHLQGADNGIGVVGPAGHYWLQGPGAGGLATATSIWADLRRSRYRRADPMPESRVVNQPASLNLAQIGIAMDPERRLIQAEPSPFSDPSFVRIEPGSHSDGDGVWRFGMWEEDLLKKSGAQG